MGDHTPPSTYASNISSDNFSLSGEVTCGNDMLDIDDTLEILTRLDLDTAYTSEKLVNLHVLLMHLMAWDNDLESMAADDIAVSETSVEKAMVFDFLYGILETELGEVDTFLDALKAQIFDVSRKISLCRHLKELCLVMDGKLIDAEESLKQSLEQVLEIKMQLAKLQRTFSYLKFENCESGGQLENDQSRVIIGRSKKRTTLEQRHVLRMLEKSLSRELDLEKKLSEFEQNEEQLKLKLHYTEQVASRMEEASEFIWGRFLEAENASEVLMGISKELLGRFQIVQFDLNGSIQRETDLNSKLKGCIEQLAAKDSLLQTLKSSREEHATTVSEVLTLTEKVKSFEEKLENKELELKNVNSLREDGLVLIEEMENLIESLKESTYEAENRAESAEAKFTQLTDTNLELTEEISFLKDSESNNTKKVTSLEKQLRDLEIQLQNSKALSEASQEQQNMLYSAIWDMETLIEDLKSKVSKAESKTETVDERCIELSEINFELNKELNFLRERVEFLESLLEKAKNMKELRAKEVSIQTKLMMDTVMQLSSERERIHERLDALTQENELLRKDMQNAANRFHNKSDIHDHSSEEACFSKSNRRGESFAKSLQEDELTKAVPGSGAELEPSESDSGRTSLEFEMARRVNARGLNFVQVFAAMFVLILSLFVVYILNRKSHLFETYHL